LRFLLRDYLQTLRERDELDRALADLFLAMNLRIVKTPARGQSERGLDIAVFGRIGHDPPTLYLVQVKMGNVTRKTWDSGPNAVRQSLNQLIDNRAYFKRLVRNARRVVIVLAHNGTIDDNARPDYDGYVSDARRRRIQIENWDLGILVSRFLSALLNERLFNSESATLLRRALAFLENPGYDLRHLRRLLGELIPGASSNDRIRKRAVVQILLALGIVEHFARTETDNLDQAVRGYEQGFLHIFAWFWRDDLLGRQWYRKMFLSLADRYLNVSLELLRRVDPLLDAPHGLAVGGSHERVEYPIRSIRMAGLAAQWFLFLARFAGDPNVTEKLRFLADFAARLKRTVPVIARPVFDDQMLEVGLYALTLFAMGDPESARGYLGEVVGRMILDEAHGGALPEGTGNLEAVSRLLLAQEKTADYLDTASTLLPMLAELAVLFEMPELYEQVRTRWNQRVDFQEWYVDETFPKWGFLPIAPVDDRTLVESSITLPDSVGKFRREIEERRAFDTAYLALLSSRRFFDLAYFVAARTYRYRLTPAVWREFLPELPSAESPSSAPAQAAVRL
jgi:hypothetical protein